MKRTAVIDVVGLSESVIGSNTPCINAFRQAGTLYRVTPAFPAVTCTAQANYLTGALPSVHGIVANGWYNRELAEVQFWKQSNHLVGGRKLWHALRETDPSFTCAQLFWWFNMYADVDWSITPRPMYPADGRKVFDIYAWPYSLRAEIKHDLGEFPFAGFWGPAAGIATPQGPADAATRWIADAAKWVESKHSPTLNLTYLPHLDYSLQRWGPADAKTAAELQRIDQIVGDLLDFFKQRSVQVILLSEYGISAVRRPIHLNRLFRNRGWLTVKEELGLELLDAGASKVFAVADHQVAHIYIHDRSLIDAVRSAVQGEPGVACVWGTAEKAAGGLAHARAGDLVAVAGEGAWFTYYYWLEDSRAPDFARTVDIHRKPGFDPVELFLDPSLSFIRARIAWRLLKKRLGFRMLMDLIPLDASLVRGSHGSRPNDPREWPVLITSAPCVDLPPTIESTRVFDLIRDSVLGR